MSRGLDHIVHAVHHLDAAAAFYRRLGFTVGARNQHPCGIHNHIVQLPGFFVELLTVAEPDKLGADRYSALFGTFNRIFLKAREGLSFLMLESQDTDADARDFDAAGIAVSPMMQFERDGPWPDGGKRGAGFSLAFARDAVAPDIGFATCRQHRPENFWNPSLQLHANGTSAIAGAVIVAENPSDHHIFLSAFTGARELNATSSGVTAHTPRGHLAIMDPAAFRSHFGVAPPDIAAGARLAALRFTVRERDTLITALEAGSAPHILHMGHVVIAPEYALGATLVFGTE